MANSSKAVSWLDNTFYSGVSDNWDDELFRQEILSHLNSTHTMLDVGAGAGIVAQTNFRNLVQKVCGIDLDPRVENNPYLDEGRLASADSIPYPDNCFDVVISDNVLEHLENPSMVFGEISRVLKPGGLFFFKTPNKFHYMPLIARLTPHSFHQFINRLRGRDVTDTFPTLYRANCRSDVNRLARESGLKVSELRFIEGRPEYMRIFAPFYVVGLLYERTVNLHRVLESIRVLLIGRLTKPPVE